MLFRIHKLKIKFQEFIWVPFTFDTFAANLNNKGVSFFYSPCILEKGDLSKSTIVIIWILEHFAKPTSA
jgi:hypothetical protein